MVKIPIKCIKSYKDTNNEIIFQANDIYQAIFGIDDVRIYDLEGMSWYFLLPHYMPNIPDRVRRVSEYFNLKQYNKMKIFA